ncbi:uncharacterized protein LOC128271973 [Anopheles cruzii]|uniref:uncharacterized protein LOC128271973 n=1 Tax=Anopheles cruzii TaxID=68878 RepID=UPI0022EC97DA|nr:uncharacterized protein LOC128271973 [Anopheles cruzii]
MVSFNSLLSIEDCETIIDRAVRKKDANWGFKIVSYDADFIPGQPGYVSAYYFLNIQFQSDDGPVETRRFFVKTLPYHDAQLTDIMERLGLFRKEAVLYNKLHARYTCDPAKVIKWAPECYLARRELIVLEDLSNDRYRTLPFQKPFNECHMKLIFERLAQMHACSIEFEINQLGGGRSMGALYTDDALFESTFTPESDWFVAGLKGILAVALERSHHSKDAAKRATIAGQLWERLERVYTLAQDTDQFRSAVVHRDLWFNNFMFTFDEDDTECDKPTGCVLIDFQLARYLPPAVDFVCALYLLTDRAHRDRYERSYVDFYHNCLLQKLANLGVSDGSGLLSKAQFEASLEHYKLLGLVWTGVLHGFVNFPHGVMERLHQEDPATYTRMSIEDRNDFILKYYDCDRFYRERMEDVVNELLEYLFDFH